MKKIYRQYTEEQLMDSDNYLRHVSAMTGEALHSKSDIAAELAIRDDEISELKSQLVEVNNNRTGVSPCAKFCEALAAKKMFDNLQQENAELKAKIAEQAAQIETLRSPLRNLINVEHERGGALQIDGQFAYRVKEVIFKDAKNALDKTPAQCLAEHDAFVGRKAFIAGVNVTGQGYNGEHGISEDEIIDLAELYVKRKLSRQASKCDT